ncbi:hypothetical protein PRIPAC_83681 [Pristionchus pacificus]|uniref:MSP domain-containing protein n=1 Tax=Pristionchus pacificus TaxID=54126 RepID=A0A2A6BL24_PRIPA|nr:hypothetical protein PRIPAC_83681 [Pristionchus pacificus]|eukprot:PDM66615.1 MSP domain-containing protein [Pristionchus pacificus]
MAAASETGVTGPELIFIDQTLICFDPEQTQNVQTVNLKRNVPQKVAFRWLTNAPTRYIVNPNRGVILDDKPVPVTIELLHQRFSPLHKMELQALVMRDNIAGDVFGDKRRTQEMQKIPLQLGTTLMNLDNAEFLSKQGSPNRSESLLSILDNEKNEDSKAQSLKDLHELLKSDIVTITKNIESTQQLEQVLTQQLAVRTEQMNDLKKSIGEAEATSAKIDEQLKEMEDEMAKLPPGDKSSSSGGAVPGICSLQ